MEKSIKEIDLLIIQSKTLRNLFKKFKMEKENQIKSNNLDTINNLKIFIKKVKQNFLLLDENLINEGKNYSIELGNTLTKTELNKVIREVNTKIKKLQNFIYGSYLKALCFFGSRFHKLGLNIVIITSLWFNLCFYI